MAPEIMRSEEYDEYSDIYSYGMILWEMVMCEVPYNGLSVPQIIGSVGYDNLQVPLPIQGNSMILSILERSLDRDRRKRPTFAHIVEILQNKNRGKENKSKGIFIIFF
jgi:serine/threonine protein kinase